MKHTDLNNIIMSLEAYFNIKDNVLLLDKTFNVICDIKIFKSLCCYETGKILEVNIDNCLELFKKEFMKINGCSQSEAQYIANALLELIDRDEYSDGYIDVYEGVVLSPLRSKYYKLKN